MLKKRFLLLGGLIALLGLPVFVSAQSTDSFCHTFTARSLDPLSRGEEVRFLNRALQRQGYNVPQSDQFSVQTVIALWLFHYRYQIADHNWFGVSYPSGYNERTRDRLNNLYPCPASSGSGQAANTDSAETANLVAVRVRVLRNSDSSPVSGATVTFSSGGTSYVRNTSANGYSAQLFLPVSTSLSFRVDKAGYLPWQGSSVYTVPDSTDTYNIASAYLEPIPSPSGNLPANNNSVVPPSSEPTSNNPAPTVPSLSLVSPLAGSSHTAGNQVVVFWNATNIPSGTPMILRLYRSGMPDPVDAISFNSFGSSYSHYLPSNLSSANYYFSLNAVVGSQAAADTGDLFSVSSLNVDPPPPPPNTTPASLSVTAPASGYQWVKNGPHSVLWTSTSIPATDLIKIDLRKADGSALPYSQFNFYQTANDGEREVNLSNVPPGSYSFRLSWPLNNPSTSVNGPTFQVVNP